MERDKNTLIRRGMWPSCSTDFLSVVVGAILLIPFGAHSAARPEASARIHQVENKVSWRRKPDSWAAVTLDMRLDERTELRTSANGTVRLILKEDSHIEIAPNTGIKLESLRNAHGGVLVQISLRRGEIKAQVSPETTSQRAFAVHTPVATAVVEGTVFSVRHDTAAGLTTVAVEDGVVFVQPVSPKIWPLNLEAGRQVSLSRSVIGPVVAAGAPPSLNEPELPYALLDLGQWQVCEIREREICGSWGWDRKAQQFNATWENGGRAVLKVEKLGDGEIILSRADHAGSLKGLTARYVGRNAGTDMEGDVGVQLIAGEVTWAGRGNITRGTWRARSYYWVDLGEDD